MRNRLPVILVALLIVVAVGVGLWIVLRSDGGGSPRIDVAGSQLDGDTGAQGGTSRSGKTTRTGKTSTVNSGSDSTTAKSANPDGSANRDSDTDPLSDRDPTNPFRNADEGAPTESLKATISGRVIDASGRGVPDATVSVEHSYSGSMAARLNRRASEGGSFGVASAAADPVATTDASGYYTASLELTVRTGTRSVTVKLSASAPGFTCDKPTEIRGVLPNDTRSNIDIRVEQGGSVYGRVVDAMGQPIEGVFVHAKPPLKDRVGGFNLQFDPRFQVRTDAEGVYRFMALLPGTWELAIRSAEYETTSGPDAITVTAGLETQVMTDFVVAMLTTIRVKLVDESGQPITDATAGENEGRRIRIRATARFEATGGKVTSRSASPDGSGYLVLRGVPDDATQMTVTVNGYRQSAPIYIRPIPGRELDAGECRLAKS